MPSYSYTGGTKSGKRLGSVTGYGKTRAAAHRNIQQMLGRRIGNPKWNLTVPEKHQLKIARQTLRMSDIGARIMGGMTKPEAREFIRKHRKVKGKRGG